MRLVNVITDSYHDIAYRGGSRVAYSKRNR